MERNDYLNIMKALDGTNISFEIKEFSYKCLVIENSDIVYIPSPLETITFIFDKENNNLIEIVVE